MKGFKIILLFICCYSLASGQTDSAALVKMKPKTMLKLGKTALEQNDPATAIDILEFYVRRNKQDAAARQVLGTAYMQIRDYDRAQATFLQAYTQDRSKAPESLYYHALMQKSNGKYDSAGTNFTRFTKEYKGEQKELKKLAKREAVFCDSILGLQNKKPTVAIARLDTSINKINTDGAPVSLSTDEMLFTSLRTETIEYVTEADTGEQKKRKLYKAARKDGKWSFAGEFDDLFNDPSFHNGNAAFSPDRKRIYFSRCQKDYDGAVHCDLYVSHLKDAGWTEPEKLPAPVNNRKYSSTMPAVALDPKKGYDVIYFVSDRPDGRGGMDLWSTVYDAKKKEYKEPRNLGSKINTLKDEITPFFDNESQTLFFSSDGWGGFGGHDVYRITGDGKKWTQVENLGQPVNSGADDVYYTIAQNREEGFFVSNRKGGNALKNSTCCDDIYYYRLLDYIKIRVDGNVNNMLDGSEPISNAKIEIFLHDKVTNQKYLVKTIHTDSAGNYNTNLEANKDYLMVVKKDDFLGTTAEVTTKNMTNDQVISPELKLVRKPKDPIHIPNILYEFDRSNLAESSKLSLDTTVLRLMEANPELIIEIQAHTDNKGNDQYNMKLSQKRAESVVNYLVSKGVDVKRLVPKGYGESVPIAPNENSDGSDNPEGRAKNRRTSLKIIGVIDAEIINEGDEQ